MRSNKCLFGIKDLQFLSTYLGRNPNSVLVTELRAEKSYEKRKVVST